MHIVGQRPTCIWNLKKKFNYTEFQIDWCTQFQFVEVAYNNKITLIIECLSRRGDVPRRWCIDGTLHCLPTKIQLYTWTLWSALDMSYWLETCYYPMQLLFSFRYVWPAEDFCFFSCRFSNSCSLNSFHSWNFMLYNLVWIIILAFDLAPYCIVEMHQWFKWFSLWRVVTIL